MSASREPVVSALSRMLRVATSPRWICSKMSSRRAPTEAGRLATEVGDAVPVLALLGDGLGGALVGGDHEPVAGVGHVVEAEDLHGHRGPGFLDLLAAVVDEGSDATPGGAGHEARRP